MAIIEHYSRNSPASLLLCSGGVESSTLLLALHQGPVRPVFLDYGQRAADQEWQHVQSQCQNLALEPLRFGLADLGEELGRLRPHRFHVPMLHRNLLAISIAASAAAALAVQQIILGISADDAVTDACSRGNFLADLGTALGHLGLQVRTPFQDLSKQEIIRFGQSLGMNWKLSYSCLLGKAQHCGQCPQCEKRRAAFAAAALQDYDVNYAR
ncbi:MAG: 7-cyano-7-deazaguanine synthase [Acidithiobacillus sp.]|nr:7-cyano-7-deazaguanine synthase [Acidithiobacillus sp.]